MRIKSSLRSVVVILLVAACKEPPGSVTTNPTVLDFGPEPIGSRVEDELGLVGAGRVAFGDHGRVSGPDASSFGVSGDEPEGEWKTGRGGMMHLYFAPTRVGTFTATYTRPMTTGSFAPVTVRGTGAYEYDVSPALTHVGHYPDGLDFGELCVNDSVKKDYVVQNNTNHDQRLEFTWQPPDSAFYLGKGTALPPIGAHGTQGWRLVFQPRHVGAVSTGLTVEFTNDHDRRTILVVKGIGKAC